MLICKNCGVELEDGLNACPLCGKDPGVRATEKSPDYNYPTEILQLQRRDIRKSLWELSGIIAFSAVTVCTIVDLIIESRLTWSVFSDILIVSSWIILTLSLHAYKKPVIIVPGVILIVLSDLFIIDSLTGGREWFFAAALPLTISLIAAVLIIVLLYNIANLKGLNILAAVFLVLSGLCILTEIILDKYVTGSVDLRWSLIAAISVFPVALLILYYHYRLKKGNPLDRYLHI